MPTIKFTATPELPFDIAHLGYKAGDVLKMSDASARRWVRRGVAVYYTGVPQRRLDVEIAEAEMTANKARAEHGSPDLPIALDPTLAPAIAPFTTGGVTTSWSEEPAIEIGNSDSNGEEAIADIAADEPATDEPKRRGRPRR